MKPTDISTIRDLLQRAFDLDYDAAYAITVALEHATTCEEFRLDGGRKTVEALNRGITQLLTTPE